MCNRNILDQIYAKSSKANRNNEKESENEFDNRLRARAVNMFTTYLRNDSSREGDTKSMSPMPDTYRFVT